MLGRTAAHDIDDRNRVRAGVIYTCARFVEAELNRRPRVTHVVHPDRAIENRGDREERGHCREEWAWQCGPSAHKRRAQSEECPALQPTMSRRASQSRRCREERALHESGILLGARAGPDDDFQGHVQFLAVPESFQRGKDFRPGLSHFLGCELFDERAE
jgi:hypothetical protein